MLVLFLARESEIATSFSSHTGLYSFKAVLPATQYPVCSHNIMVMGTIIASSPICHCCCKPDLNPSIIDCKTSANADGTCVESST